jgi:hypothetical protein
MASNVRQGQTLQNKQVTMSVTEMQFAMIEFLVAEKHPDKDISIQIRNMYQEAASLCVMIFRQIPEIRNGKDDLSKDAIPGHFTGMGSIRKFPRF